jgi:hypothetical protein
MKAAELAHPKADGHRGPLGVEPGGTGFNPSATGPGRAAGGRYRRLLARRDPFATVASVSFRAG